MQPVPPAEPADHPDRMLVDHLPVDLVVGQTLCAVCLHLPLDRVRGVVAEGKAGVVLPGRGDMPDPETARARLAALAEVAPHPLLFAADFEAGAASMVARGATRLPSLLALGAIRDPGERREAAEQAARVTAREALALGVRLDFAPVADLADRADNPIINVRAPHADPEIAADLVAAWVRAAQDEGMGATAKHFPGHGPVSADSHLVTPVCHEGADQLRARELRPFRAALSAGVAAVMVAHVHYPALQPPDERRERRPASLSPSVVGDLLRRRMGYEGVIMTDSLSMKAITREMSLASAAEAALRAGNDLCLIEEEFEAVHAHLVERIESGALDEALVRGAARRVLALKRHLGLVADAPPAALDLAACGRREHAEVALQIARRALTLVAGRIPEVPEAAPAEPLRMLTFYNAPAARSVGAPALLAAALRGRVVERCVLCDDADPRELDRAERWIAEQRDPDAPRLLVVQVRRPIAYRPAGLDLAPCLRPIFSEAVRHAAALVFLGSVPPRAAWAGLRPDVPALATHSADGASAIAAAEALLGAAPAPGVAPILAG